MKINERLKYLRNEKGLTQMQLARELKLGQTTIAAYENGTHDPQIFSMIAYADFFNCSLDFLVGRENEARVIKNNSENSFKADEKKLLADYRKLSVELKEILLKDLNTLKNSSLNDFDYIK